MCRWVLGQVLALGSAGAGAAGAGAAGAGAAGASTGMAGTAGTGAVAWAHQQVHAQPNLMLIACHQGHVDVLEW